MKKFILLSTLILISCEGEDRGKIKSSSIPYERICIDGVIYLEWYRTLSVKLDTLGNVERCYLKGGE